MLWPASTRTDWVQNIQHSLPRPSGWGRQSIVPEHVMKAGLEQLAGWGSHCHRWSSFLLPVQWILLPLDLNPSGEVIFSGSGTSFAVPHLRSLHTRSACSFPLRQRKQRYWSLDLIYIWNHLKWIINTNSTKNRDQTEEGGRVNH